MVEHDAVNILVVDDLPEKLLVYRTILEELGQNIVTARTGSEALKQVLGQDFAVILLDVNMPDMDGFETAALIRKRKKSQHTPIIFVTAFNDEVRTAQGYAHGAVDYIPTPVVPEVLRAKVRVFVELFRMTQQLQRQAEERIALAEETSKRTAAEESNRRLSFLAQAGAILGQSLDLQVTTRDVARLAVPFLADLAVLALPAERGTRERCIVVRRGEPEARLEEGGSLQDLPPLVRGVVERAYETAAFARTDDDTSEPQAIAVPLKSRGRLLAVLALAQEESGRRFSPSDLAVADSLASRSASALDNAALYRDVQEADRQKNEFLSMLAHELRNPLAPISNSVQVLRLRGLDSPELQHARDVIERQVKHLARLVDDLLDVSRITRGKIRLKLEVVELQQVVAHAVEAIRPAVEAKRHRLQVTLPPEPIWLDADSARLTQVLTNLLNNAAKYTEEGGAIELSGARSGDSIVLHVRDNGMGISAEMLGSIFDLFTQAERALDRSQGGLGVGLTLVRRLVEMHGGSVEASSAGPGKGSEFIVRLPVCATPQQGENGQHGAAVLPSTAAPQRILIVDDSVDNADTLGALMRLEGYEVHLAHSGEAALEKAWAVAPDAIVLDIGLPGMDGYEVARRLRAHPATSATVLIALTGYGQQEDIRRGRHAGFNHHLVKPVDFGILKQTLGALAQRGRSATPSPEAYQS